MFSGVKTRTIVPIAAAVLVAVIVGFLVSAHHAKTHRVADNGGNNGGGTRTSTSTSTVSPQPSSVPPSSAPSSSQPAMAVPGTAEYVATEYASAAHSLSYRQAGLGAWVPAVKPYVAPAYYASLVAQQQAAAKNSDAGDAAYWRKIQANHTIVTVQVLSAIQPAGVGHDATHATVRVQYSLVTRTDANPDPNPGVIQAESCMMVRSGGRWLVTLVVNGGG